MAQIKAVDVGIGNGASLAPQFMNPSVMGANASKIAMWLEKGTALEQSALLQYLKEARSKFKAGAPQIGTIDSIIKRVQEYRPITSSATGNSQTTQTQTGKYKLNQNLSRAILYPNGGYAANVKWLNQLSVPNLSQPINIEQFVRGEIGATPADGLAIMNAIKAKAPILYQRNANFITLLNDNIGRWQKLAGQGNANPATGGSQTTQAAQTGTYKLNQNLSQAILSPNGGYYTDVRWLNQLSVPNLSQPINIEQFVRRQIGATPADGLAIMNAIKAKAPISYQRNANFITLLNDNIERWQKLAGQGNANPVTQPTGNTSTSAQSSKPNSSQKNGSSTKTTTSVNANMTPAKVTASTNTSAAAATPATNTTPDTTNTASTATPATNTTPDNVNDVSTNVPTPEVTNTEPVAAPTTDTAATANPETANTVSPEATDTTSTPNTEEDSELFIDNAIKRIGEFAGNPSARSKTYQNAINVIQNMYYDKIISREEYKDYINRLKVANKDAKTNERAAQNAANLQEAYKSFKSLLERMEYTKNNGSILL